MKTIATTVLCFLIGTPPIAAADFLRGDANRDGHVSVADGYALLAYLFRDGSGRDCLDALDANDDGSVNLVDAIGVLTYGTAAAPPPCPPFPDPGEDPTDDELACDDFAIEDRSVEDPTARLEILGGTVDDSRVELVVGLASSFPLGAFWGRWSIEGGVIANGYSGDGVETHNGTADNPPTMLETQVAGGQLHLAVVTHFMESDPIEPGELRDVLSFSLCLDEDADPGSYAMTFDAGELVVAETSETIALPPSTFELTVMESPTAGCPSRRDATFESCASPAPNPNPNPGDCDGVEPPPLGADVPFRRGDVNADGELSISDALALRRWLFLCEAGPPCRDTADVNDDGVVNLVDTIYILGSLFLDGAPPSEPAFEPGIDPTADGLPCAEYVVVPPVESGDVVEIGTVSATPGELIEIPVYVTNSVPVEAFQVLMRFDPDTVRPVAEVGIDVPAMGFENTVYEDRAEESAVLYSMITRMTGQGGDDVLSASFIPSLIHEGFETPPGERQPVFTIRVVVSDDAEPGTTVELVPLAEPFGPYDLRTELTHAGESRFVTTLPRVLPGRVEIVGDVIILRGDSNDDENVDIADGIYTLDYLFRRGNAPRCLDAADVDDDGVVNVSDAVNLFGTLFLGTDRIAPPYPHRGRDPTPDSLGCGR